MKFRIGYVQKNNLKAWFWLGFFEVILQKKYNLGQNNKMMSCGWYVHEIQETYLHNVNWQRLKSFNLV